MQIPADGVEQSAAKHPAQTAKNIRPHIVRIAIEAVAGTRRKDVLALFQGRVTWSAVKHWRAGRTVIPLWAATILADRLRPLATLADQLERYPRPNRTAAGAAALRRWHAQRKSRAQGPAVPSSDSR
jgi:hypothetical protein